ncbi:murein hydrolase activator EnvC family protein [Curtobacterium sp. NPDC089689]|uniref:murein hydrolase activator EnvC family protein n=1 Tax=Curtobacterium sp. NPDC089689 TaxID=3363968 RepID=UPI0038153C71
MVVAAAALVGPEVGRAGVGQAVVGHVGAGHAGAGHAGAGHAGAGHAVVEHAGVGHVAGGADGAPWVWPTGSRVVVRPWEAPADDYAAGHRGIDVPSSIGTPAVAVADGTVSFAGAVAGRSVVSVDHGGGLVSTLDSVSPEVTTGDAVSQGDVVGRVTVGHCPATDPCVHLGARLDDRYVDPTVYLPAAAWPVLLPESDWRG